MMKPKNIVLDINFCDLEYIFCECENLYEAKLLSFTKKYDCDYSNTYLNVMVHDYESYHYLREVVEFVQDICHGNEIYTDVEVIIPYYNVEYVDIEGNRKITEMSNVDEDSVYVSIPFDETGYFLKLLSLKNEEDPSRKFSLILNLEGLNF